MIWIREGVISSLAKEAGHLCRTDYRGLSSSNKASSSGYLTQRARWYCPTKATFPQAQALRSVTACLNRGFNFPEDLTQSQPMGGHNGMCLSSQLCGGAQIGRSWSRADPISKIIKTKRAGDMPQVIECMPRKHKAQNSILQHRQKITWYIKRLLTKFLILKNTHENHNEM